MSQALTGVTGGSVYHFQPQMNNSFASCIDIYKKSLALGTPTTHCTSLDTGSSWSAVNGDQSCGATQEWSCSGASNQSFKVIDLGNGYFQLQSVNSGLCLDVYGGAVDSIHTKTGNADGTIVQQYTCKSSNNANQAWQLQSSNGYYKLVSQDTSGDGKQRCLDVRGGSSATTNGTVLDVYTCNGGANQTWQAVSESAGGGGNFSSRFIAPYVATYVDTNLSTLATNTGNPFWTLAFVIPPSGGGCTATWNGTSSLGSTNYDKSSNSYVSQLRANNSGEVAVSFGGAAGGELAWGVTSSGQACTSVSSLQSAYQSVINQFNPPLKRIDFDIEGSPVNDHTSIDRRSQAIANLQSANSGLLVSFTLGVDVISWNGGNHIGLPSAQQYVLTSAKNYGVAIDVVNIMTMDYSNSWSSYFSSLGAAAVDGAQTVNAQLASWGVNASVGITPLLATQDSGATGCFSTALPGHSSDAQTVETFAQGASYVKSIRYWIENDTNSPVCPQAPSNGNSICSSNVGGCEDYNSSNPGSGNSYVNVFKQFGIFSTYTCAFQVTTNTYDTTYDGNITYKNSGNQTETNPTVTFTLPNGSVFDSTGCVMSSQNVPSSITAVSCSTNGQNVSYNFTGTLAVGSSIGLYYTTNQASEPAATNVTVTSGSSCQ